MTVEMQKILKNISLISIISLLTSYSFATITPSNLKDLLDPFKTIEESRKKYSQINARELSLNMKNCLLSPKNHRASMLIAAESDLFGINEGLKKGQFDNPEAFLENPTPENLKKFTAMVKQIDRASGLDNYLSDAQKKLRIELKKAKKAPKVKVMDIFNQALKEPIKKGLVGHSSSSKDGVSTRRLRKGRNNADFLKIKITNAVASA